MHYFFFDKDKIFFATKYVVHKINHILLSTRAYQAASKKGSNFVVVIVVEAKVGSKHVFVSSIIQDGVNVTFQSDNLRLTQSSSNYIIIFKTLQATDTSYPFLPCRYTDLT